MVRETVNDKLVVVNAVSSAPEEASLLGALKGANVPKVSDWIPAGSRTDTVNLVKLIIKDEELLPGSVSDPALMSIFWKIWLAHAWKTGGGEILQAAPS